jgi:predicted PurR-regulated permease PerM
MVTEQVDVATVPGDSANVEPVEVVVVDKETRAGGRSPTPRIGVLAWSFVGVVVATVIVVSALGAVSEIVLPLIFAAVLAVVFRPLVGKLIRHGWKPSLAAGVIVLGLLVVMAGVLVATVTGILDQTDEIGASVDAAVQEAVDSLGVDPGAMKDAQAATEDAAPMVNEGVVAALVAGFGSVVTFAGALILGALIMYYLLKDGGSLRRAVVRQVDESIRGDVNSFIGEACRILRDYGRGRTVMSAIVAAVIGLASLLLGLPLVFTIVVANFIGGYIPYIGAFLGGGLAVIVALGDGGLGVAVVMLIVVLASNLVLENFVEPKVMGRTLDIHPLLVLVATALGGFLAGIVGLILAVPFTVIAGKAISRLRARGFFKIVVDKAQPTVKDLLH